MGNRAVIVSHDTNKENAKEKIGIYLHWYGSKNHIETFLKEAKKRGIRTVDDDPQYFWARFIQTVTDLVTILDNNYELSVGVGIVSQLDTNNGDNGVYYIDSNFEITKQTDGSEFY